ncbi:uncharacterized protein TNCV_4538501 [Trichonephila clavipes]|uniref:Uncharacterized protein n=1 Tax=Trichonephila clavipes TaxID=2585209 RepID=A0A8X6WFB6_TRICX|nr:uncharacterized protein TNCV_4538501 [Trichonephila clavipes]
MCLSKGGDQRKTFLTSAKPPQPPKDKPVGNAVKGFKEWGIEPHTPLVFSECDFAAARTTNHDVIGDVTEINSANPQTKVVENQHINPPEEPELITNTDSDVPKKPCCHLAPRQSHLAPVLGLTWGTKGFSRGKFPNWKRTQPPNTRFRDHLILLLNIVGAHAIKEVTNQQDFQHGFKKDSGTLPFAP